MGILTLIPTPIDDTTPLESLAFGVLKRACENYEDNLILIEDLKPCRRRWLSWGLPREALEFFIEFNEHTQQELKDKIISSLQKGKNAFLMSDGGLPAFCDPGQKLVLGCHQNGIQVTSTPFCNSISLAISLSGINCQNFFFAGFLPKNSEERLRALAQFEKMESPVVLMDTPYRLSKLLSELQKIGTKRNVFLGMDLNQESEQLLYGKLSKVCSRYDDSKREFILILE